MDLHLGIAEVFGVKEFTELLSFFRGTEIGQDFELRAELC